MAKKSGRKPLEFDENIGTEICNAIASTNKGLRALRRENKHWPSLDTIFQWRINNDRFACSYARAKTHQIECLVDYILEIVDDTSNDTIIDAETGKLVINHEHITRARLRIDTIKWLAGKLAPKIYGDRIIADANLYINHEDAVKELE